MSSWTWVWPLWILALITSFAVFEYVALTTGRTTLSRWVWNASKAWPPLVFVAGLIAGGLAVHFWWHWCPDLGSVNGSLHLLITQSNGKLS